MTPRSAADAFVSVAVATSCAAIAGLEDLRLYGKVLTDAEVTALYGSTR